MQQPKLFMLLLGCRPNGRNTEQHDILFAIGNSLRELIPQINEFWPDGGRIHIDAWREVTEVDGYSLQDLPKDEASTTELQKLFFLNLGGYKQNEFEEFHYKMLTVSSTKAEAINEAKQSAFYKHTGFKGADSHIDDKYGVDVDDVYEIQDILHPDLKAQYRLVIEKLLSPVPKDDMHLGYFKLTSL